MENQITRPHCKRTIANNAIVDAAVKGAGHTSDFVSCECGERITYWAIVARLSDQKKPLAKILTWFHSVSKGQV
jgi:hypothetical protein